MTKRMEAYVPIIWIVDQANLENGKFAGADQAQRTLFQVLLSLFSLSVNLSSDGYVRVRTGFIRGSSRVCDLHEFVLPS